MGRTRRPPASPSARHLNQIGRGLSVSEHIGSTRKPHICQKLGLAPGDADTEIIAEAERRGVPNLRP